MALGDTWVVGANLPETLIINQGEAGYGEKVILASASDANSTGILVSMASNVARTSGYNQGVEVTLAPHVDDTADTIYSAIRINDISADGDADKAAIDIGAGWSEAIIMQSGDVLFEDHAAMIFSERGTDGDGYDLTVAGCDGYDSGATERAGGDLILQPGAGVNAGADGIIKVIRDMVIEDGLLTIKETTTPTAVVDYGKVYCKSDNNLYFQDGAGDEHQVAFV